MSDLPRWVQIIASIALGILLFWVGFFVFMPRATLGRIADAQIEKATRFQYDVDIQGAALAGPSAVRADGVRLRSRTSAIEGISPGAVQIERARIGAGLLSLVRQKPAIRARIDFPSGTMRVFAKIISKSERDIEIQFHDVALTDIGILRDILKMPIQGTVRGTIAGVTDESGTITSGKVDLNILSARIGPRRITGADLPEEVRRIFAGEIVIPAVNAGDLLLRGDIEDGVFKITEFVGQGPDLQLGGEGQINLRSPVTASNLQITLNVAIDAAWVENAQIGGILSSVPLITRAQQDDALVFAVSGTLGKPAFNAGGARRRATGR